MKKLLLTLSLFIISVTVWSQNVNSSISISIFRSEQGWSNGYYENVLFHITNGSNANLRVISWRIYDYNDNSIEYNSIYNEFTLSSGQSSAFQWNNNTGNRIIMDKAWVVELQYYNLTTGGEKIVKKALKRANMIGSNMGLEDISNELDEVSDKEPEYVDLGLPSGLLWATTNVGANQPEEYGSYFAWGETTPKAEYSWVTYQYANGSETTLTKYCNNQAYGSVDYKEVLDEQDDAATVNWGKPWRTPTLSETQELINCCSWVYQSRNGVKGYLVTGTNGNSIFLPAGGVKQYDASFFNGTDACVQSSTIFNASNGTPSSASVLLYDENGPHYWYGWSRCWGYPVRPVCSPSSWKYDAASHTLIILRNDNYDFNKREDRPWNEYIEQIEKIIVEDGITYIGNYFFEGCVNLTSVTIPNSVTSIGNDAFRNCIRLVSVTIPNSVKSIGERAFDECRGLTLITIPNSVTSIGNDAFVGCRGLSSVTIPDNIKYIGNGTFFACSGLTSVTIPNSVTSIGDFAFGGCISLTSVTIPNSVTSIGNNAFDSCTGLTTVSSFIENPFGIAGRTSDARTFPIDVFNNATLYVPVGMKDEYQKTEGWKNFRTIKEQKEDGAVINQLNATSDMDAEWYTLDGRQLEGEPTEKGVYLYNGKKIYVK